MLTQIIDAGSENDEAILGIQKSREVLSRTFQMHSSLKFGRKKVMHPDKDGSFHYDQAYVGSLINGMEHYFSQLENQSDYVIRKQFFSGFAYSVGSFMGFVEKSIKVKNYTQACLAVEQLLQTFPSAIPYVVRFFERKFKRLPDNERIKLRESILNVNKTN